MSSNGPGRPVAAFARRTILGVTALSLAAGGLAWTLLSGGRPGGEAAAQAGPPPAPPVTVGKPLRRELVEWDEFTGQFAAVDTVEVRARVSGYLDSVHFTDGQIVRKGDLLFVIDPRPFEAAVASRQAELTQSEARLELARRQLGRAEQLRERDFVAISVFEERQQEMRVAAAGVDVARAALRMAQLDLSFTRVTAPLAGRIGQREISVGNLVAGGMAGASTLLTTIVSLDPIRIEFDMSESEFLAYQRAAQDSAFQLNRDGTLKVQVRLFDETDWPREGRLDFLDNRVNRSAGTIRARAELENDDLFLTPGQFGRLRLPGSVAYEAMLLPDSAIVSDQANKIVMTVAPDGTVVPKIVRPGPLEQGLRVIRSGLSPDDLVIINGLMRARPGGKVTPEPGTVETAETPAN
ncbi:MAG TPA: efflux RND transporter periplasmic adaptor subunit [Arenibaculum sp.]|nr:efflux RND transporter periplasmic adaptor subunit [Arenibaculum sp.]